jgi:hypothetical protein
MSTRKSGEKTADRNDWSPAPTEVPGTPLITTRLSCLLTGAKSFSVTQPRLCAFKNAKTDKKYACFYHRQRILNKLKEICCA